MGVVLKQMLILILCGMINRHALETGVVANFCTFSVVVKEIKCRLFPL
jgi:hypothetical protein